MSATRPRWATGADDAGGTRGADPAHGSYPPPPSGRPHGLHAPHGPHASHEPRDADGPEPARGSGAGRRKPSRILRALLRKTPLPLRGLRSRLVVAFALVAVVSALSTGALAFREARTGVLQQSQDAVIRQFRDTVDAQVRANVSTDALIPPRTAEQHARTQAWLEALVANVARASQSQHWQVLATYGDMRAAYAGDDTFDELTPELLRSVRTQASAVFQRVDSHGRPILVVGLPVAYNTDDGSTTLSGLAMYLVVPQDNEQGYVKAMVTAIEHATLVALGLAVVLALLAASGVLRPVRALRRATRRMAEGHLDVRLAVNGSDELADLSQSFNDTAAALEQSVTELRRLEAQARRFVADVSHELRTPLAAMSAVTDVLDEDALHLDRETGDALRLISEGTVRLTGLVNDLMEISRFDAGAVRLNLDEVDLAELIERTLASRGWLHQVEAWLPESGFLRARVDPRRFDVVVANLVGNALKHGAPPVRLSLTVRDEGRDGVWAVVEVADNGPGIAEKSMPHIFERFYKADSGRTRSESSGLGLAITVENVHLHGGRIHAANRPEGGAAFTVEIPLHTASEEDGRAGGGS